MSRYDYEENPSPVLLLGLLAVLGGVGFWVYKKRKDKGTTSSDSGTSSGQLTSSASEEAHIQASVEGTQALSSTPYTRSAQTELQQRRDRCAKHLTGMASEVGMARAVYNNCVRTIGGGQECMDYESEVDRLKENYDEMLDECAAEENIENWIAKYS